jgi:hypothetical protein
MGNRPLLLPRKCICHTAGQLLRVGSSIVKGQYICCKGLEGVKHSERYFEGKMPRCSEEKVERLAVCFLAPLIFIVFCVIFLSNQGHM